MVISDLKNWLIKTFDIRDVFCFGGTSLIAWGVYDIYPPAAFIITGAIFFYISIIRGTK
ncbi:MAG: hypothetical protein UX37_C0024G0010 [Microgenomates group bacterium GW2011_GWA2_46_16]|nr:MAG: hypothetical protein UX37_C0024G0010 [Microgenomates group bacterium GW2011_GWA2_46_16]